MAEVQISEPRRLRVAMLFLLAVASSVQPSPLAAAGRSMLDAALRSPLYKAVMVPMAKSTMVRTAEDNGVPWRGKLEWIKAQGPWHLPAAPEPPEYYRRPFHAYEEGNLCWEAAWEGEIASRAVGARNFPRYGAEGEQAFRSAFDEALGSLGATCPDGGTIVDLGCGSGVSTRRLAENWPAARRVLGIDLSPHFIAVGQRLLELAAEPPAGSALDWVNEVEADARLALACADAARTGLDDGSADVVCLSLVVHELPPEATRAITAEAARVLKPGGQLWLTEMDFDTPGFTKLRANPLLFSLIRATEPYLDVYADYQPQLPRDLRDAAGFRQVQLAAATGRHFALVATKPASADAPADAIDDRRAETAKADTHLKTWESRTDSEAA